MPRRTAGHFCRKAAPRHGRRRTQLGQTGAASLSQRETLKQRAAHAMRGEYAR